MLHICCCDKPVNVLCTMGFCCIWLGSRDAVLIGKSHNYKLLDVIRASPWGERKARHWVSVSLPYQLLQAWSECIDAKRRRRSCNMQRSWNFGNGDSVTIIYCTHTHCLSMISSNSKESKMAGRGKTMCVSSMQDIFPSVLNSWIPTLHNLWSGIHNRWAVIFSRKEMWCDFHTQPSHNTPSTRTNLWSGIHSSLQVMYIF